MVAMCMLAPFRGAAAFGVRRPSLAFSTATPFLNNKITKERPSLLPTNTRSYPMVAAASLSTEATTQSSSASPTPVRPYDQENIELGLGSYTPSEFESKIYQWWEASGCFLPDAKPNNNPNKKPYVLPMPPPNVTGRLHMGHAIFVALQDILARFHRMRGRPVLWLPGTCNIYFSFFLSFEGVVSRLLSPHYFHFCYLQARIMLESQPSCKWKNKLLQKAQHERKLVEKHSWNEFGNTRPNKEATLHDNFALWVHQRTGVEKDLPWMKTYRMLYRKLL
jgi:tRNA synthetases class I (I, L, M and V)